MNGNQKPQPNPHEQAVARSIAGALETPSPRRAFVDALGERLDHEFAARQPIGEGRPSESTLKAAGRQEQ